MIRRRHLRALGGLVLAAGVAAGSGAAFAHPGPMHGKPTPNQTRVAPAHTRTAPVHPKPPHPGAVTGTVTNVGSGTLSVQTANGTVTVTFTSTTHVTRFVAGTTADLTNAHVNLHFAKGTTTVDAINIHPAPKAPNPNKPTPSATKPAPVHKGPHHPTVTLTGTPTPKHPRQHVIHDGIVTGTTSTTITIRGHGDRTATYTLATNVSITKQVAGTTNDLKAGQTISAHGPANGPAHEIVILKS